MIEPNKVLPLGDQPIGDSRPMPVDIRKFPSSIQMQVIKLRSQGVSAREITNCPGVTGKPVETIPFKAVASTFTVMTAETGGIHLIIS